MQFIKNATKPVWANQLTRLPCLEVYFGFQFMYTTTSKSCSQLLLASTSSNVPLGRGSEEVINECLEVSSVKFGYIFEPIGRSLGSTHSSTINEPFFFHFVNCYYCRVPLLKSNFEFYVKLTKHRLKKALRLLPAIPQTLIAEALSSGSTLQTRIKPTKRYFNEELWLRIKCNKIAFPGPHYVTNGSGHFSIITSCHDCLVNFL